jgi:hypothetical protein
MLSSGLPLADFYMTPLPHFYFYMTYIGQMPRSLTHGIV